MVGIDDGDRVAATAGHCGHDIRIAFRSGRNQTLEARKRSRRLVTVAGGWWHAGRAGKALDPRIKFFDPAPRHQKLDVGPYPRAGVACLRHTGRGANHEARFARR